MDDEVEQAKYLLNFLATGMKILNARLLMLLALVLTFVLYAWAMIGQTDPLRIGIATLFAVLVFLPTVWLDVRGNSKGA